MTAAVIAVYYFNGASEGAGVDCESSGLKFNRDDTQSGTSAPVPIPTATGTKYSWYKQTALKVTTLGDTNISNFTIKMASTPTTGLYLYFNAESAFAESTAGGMPADGGTNGAVPAGYTAMTESAQQWYAGPISTATTGRKGDFARLLFGVGYNYAGGGGSAIALPNLTVSYDEA